MDLDGLLLQQGVVAFFERTRPKAVKVTQIIFLPSKPSAPPIPPCPGESEVIFFASGLFLLVGAKLIFAESKKNYPM